MGEQFRQQVHVSPLAGSTSANTTSNSSCTTIFMTGHSSESHQILRPLARTSPSRLRQLSVDTRRRRRVQEQRKAEKIAAEESVRKLELARRRAERQWTADRFLHAPVAELQRRRQIQHKHDPEYGLETRERSCLNAQQGCQCCDGSSMDTVSFTSITNHVNPNHLWYFQSSNSYPRGLDPVGSAFYPVGGHLVPTHTTNANVQQFHSTSSPDNGFRLPPATPEDSSNNFQKPRTYSTLAHRGTIPTLVTAPPDLTRIPPMTPNIGFIGRLCSQAPPLRYHATSAVAPLELPKAHLTRGSEQSSHCQFCNNRGADPLQGTWQRVTTVGCCAQMQVAPNHDAACNTNQDSAASILSSYRTPRPPSTGERLPPVECRRPRTSMQHQPPLQHKNYDISTQVGSTDTRPEVQKQLNTDDIDDVSKLIRLWDQFKGKRNRYFLSLIHLIQGTM